MVQIFTEHLLCARHQKYDTGTVPALMGLPVQKAIIGGHCNTGGGAVSERIHWSNVMPTP